MQHSKVRVWFEYAGGLAVLVGILLVVMELRQSNQHAKAESIREIYLNWADILQYESEYQIDRLVAKAVRDPDDLSDQELYRLDDYFELVMNNYLMWAVMQREGELVYLDVLQEVPDMVDGYYYYPVAQAWLKTNGGWIEGFDPDFYQSMMLAVERSSDGGTDFWIDEWKRAISHE